MSYSEPVTASVLEKLPAKEAAELAVWSANHPTIWDWRIHRPATCPFGYTIRYSLHKDDVIWARFLHSFYRAKHQEQGKCNCQTN